MAVIDSKLTDSRCDIRQGDYSYTLTYRVTTDGLDDDPLAVLNGALAIAGNGPDGLPVNPVPNYGSVYSLGGSTDISAFARDFSATRSDPSEAPSKWTVDVTFSQLPPGESPSTQQTSQDDPLARPVREWIEFQTFSEVIEQDHEDNPIVNLAEQPFDEPATQEQEYEVLVFEKNFATLGEIRSLNRDYRRRLNDDEFGGYPALHCQCLPILASPPKYAAHDSGTTYYTATFRILCSDRPWVREFVNRGFKHFAFVDTGGGTFEDVLVMATDPVLNAAGELTDDRVVVSEPVLLSDDTYADGPGHRLPKGVEGNVVTFQTRPTADFSQLPVQPSA